MQFLAKNVKKSIFFTHQPATRLSKSDKICNEKSLLTPPYYFPTPYLPSQTEALSKT